MIHLRADVLEDFALGRLPEKGVARVEEHLLVCDTCRNRLDNVEAFVISVRAGSADTTAVTSPSAIRGSAHL